MTRRTILQALAGAALARFAGGVAAQATTFAGAAQPLRLVQGFPPGGAVDRVAKVLAPEMSRDLARPVIGEYLTGANGVRAIRAVADSASDTDVLLFATSAIANRTDPNVAESRVETLRPVIMTSATPMAVVVRASLGIDDMAGLVKRLRAEPPLSYGSSGTGNGTHIAAAELVHQVAGTATHVPYQGGAPMLTDLLGGHIDFALFGVAGTLLQQPSLRLLAVSTARRTRLPRFDHLPTIAETVAPAYDLSLWQALLAPPRVSVAAIADLNRRLNTILGLPSVQAAMAEAGAEPIGGTIEHAAALIQVETERFARVVGR
ncbi:MAG: tripartite tricarboxylate transporter substrate binding protein [Betaproteobacteria bacterium]